MPVSPSGGLAPGARGPQARGVTTISGRVAVITGAARGIGRVLVDRFLDAGARVVALDRDHGGRVPGGVLQVAADITDRNAVAAARAEAIERFGRVDVLVNNAAMRQRDRFTPTGLSTVLGASDADWQAMFAVNVLGTLTVVREFVGPMIAAGGGSVVCIGTSGTMTGAVGAGVWRPARPVPLNQPYEASKAALASMVFSLAAELREHDIAVNLLLPSGTMTTGSAEMAAARAATGFVNKPYLRSEHVVPAALHLAAQRGRAGLTGTAVDAVAWNEQHGLGGSERWRA